MIIKALLILSLAITCITQKSQGQQDAQPSQQPGGTAQGAGAPDSGYVDLAKRGSGKLKQAIADYLRECDLRTGENPNGLWVQTGTATIQGTGGSPGWGENRKLAFIEAQLLAQANLVKSIALRSTVVTLREVTSDDSVLSPQFSEPKGFDDRVAGKLEQLTEATLDKALKDLGEVPAPTEKLQSKRDLYRKALMRVSMQSAFSQVSGFYVLQCFEAVDEDNPGKVSVGVVIGRRPNSLSWISSVAKGGGAQGVPRDKPGRSLTDRIPNDPSILYERFGVRVVADESGQINLIAYGQSSPEVRKGMSDEQIEAMIETAGSYAEQDAINSLTEFLDSSLAWQRRVEEGSRTRRSEMKGTIDGIDVTREENLTDTIKKLNEKSVRWSSAFVRGAKPHHTWQGNHPEYGTPIVGCVIVWSPESAAAAGRFNDTNPSGSGSGFKPTGPTPGVKRSRGEDVPNGKGGGEPDEHPSASPVAVECDGTDAVGLGTDREAAILSALENAVRQACGVSVSSLTETEKLSESSIADVRVNEACAEMRAVFASSSLFKQDISVRTKGLVSEYKVLAEEMDADGRRVRIRICAQIPKFDPRNPRPGAKPTLIVLPPTSRQTGYAVMGNRITADEVARSLETEMARELFRMKVFTLLERERLSAVLGEQQFIASGLADLKEQVKLGKLSAADSVLISEVEDVVATQEEKVIKLTGNRVIKRYAGAKINWRIVSVGTGEVLDQDSVSISLDDEGFRQMSSVHPGTPIPTALMAMAVAKLAPEVASRAAPLRVAAVVGDKIFLNRGKETLAPGQQFSVYRLGGELKDPTTGASLGRSESKVGAIKVERAEADFSIAVLVSGQLGSEDAGAICRKS